MFIKNINLFNFEVSKIMSIGMRVLMYWMLILEKC